LAYINARALEQDTKVPQALPNLITSVGKKPFNCLQAVLAELSVDLQLEHASRLAQEGFC
jgi:hypothetical protein